MAEFRAQKYTNRKDEEKLSVSGSVEAFKRLLKGDESTQEAFDAELTAGLKQEVVVK